MLDGFLLEMTAPGAGIFARSEETR
jgi:hypothetical protein